MSLDQAEARKIALFASQGQHLHADANAQQRPSGSGKFEHRVTQPGTRERLYARIEGADPGQDQTARPRDRLRRRYDIDLHAQFAKHVAYRPGIADTVVDDAYVCHCA